MDRTTPIYDNEVYHLYNRGNNKQRLFFDASDYTAFLRKLHGTAKEHHVNVIAYTLMPNHYHVLAEQQRGGCISDMMEALGTSYAKRFNLKYKHVGHVFQAPYKYTYVATVDGLMTVARYIHLNPVRARLVQRPEDWAHSDFRRHLEATADGFLARGLSKEQGNLLPSNYVELVRQGAEDLEAVRRYLFGGEEGFLPPGSRKDEGNLQL
jgi:REP element-mobilizing transposase RayT